MVGCVMLLWSNLVSYQNIGKNQVNSARALIRAVCESGRDVLRGDGVMKLQ